MSMSPGFADLVFSIPTTRHTMDTVCGIVMPSAFAVFMLTASHSGEENHSALSLPVENNDS